MESLPTEVLILIFTYLHREEKLRCMPVCRRWAHILNSGHIIETVSISSSPSSALFNQQYKTLMYEVQNNRSIGQKCKRLVLDHHSRIGFDKVALAEYFPNLTFLALLLIESKSINSTTKYTQFQSDKLKSWRNNLETLIERSYTNRLVDFLETGVFTRLTTLSLSPSSIVRDKPLSGLIEALKNTPVLKNFQLNFHRVDIFDLKELHKNVPTLVSLVMNNCTLTSSRGTIRNTQSSNAIETLKIRYIYENSLTPDVVEFLISTYTNLKSLSLVLSDYDCTNYRVTDTQLVPLVTELVTHIGMKLTELDFRVPVKTPQVYTFLEKRQSAHQLKKLKINILLAKRVLYSMISLASHCHLNTLSLTQVPLLDFGIFKKLTGLKVLQLAFKRKMINWPLINLGDLNINLPESLETLELSFIKMVVIDNHATTTLSHHSSHGGNSRLGIKCLKLVYADISENTSNFLSGYFHRLSSLILLYCRMGVDLDLTSHHLAYVNLVYYEKHHCAGYLELEELDENKLLSTHLTLSTVNSNTSATTTTKERTRHYMYRKPLYNGINPRFNSNYCNVHDHSLRNISRPTPYDESLNYFHFKCASVQSFYYNGYLLL